MKLKGDMGVSHLPSLGNIAVLKAKMVVKWTSAGQFTGQRTIGELLLLETKKKSYTENLAGQPLIHPKNLVKLRPWWGCKYYRFPGGLADDN